MREKSFREWMMKQERFFCGKWGYYSENAVASRVACLNKLESHFKTNLDDWAKNRETAIKFLVKIRQANIEDLAHTPLSNAFRHYYNFVTGDKIEKIFN